MRACSESALPSEPGGSSADPRFLKQYQDFKIGIINFYIFRFIGGCQAGKTAWFVSFALKE